MAASSFGGKGWISRAGCLSLVVPEKGFVLSVWLPGMNVLCWAQPLLLCILHGHSCLQANNSLWKDPGLASLDYVMSSLAHGTGPDRLRDFWTFAGLTVGNFPFFLRERTSGEEKLLDIPGTSS